MPLCLAGFCGVVSLIITLEVAPQICISGNLESTEFRHF